MRPDGKCSRCLRKPPEVSFSAGRGTICKECMRAYAKDYRAGKPRQKKLRLIVAWVRVKESQKPKQCMTSKRTLPTESFYR